MSKVSINIPEDFILEPPRQRGKQKDGTAKTGAGFVSRPVVQNDRHVWHNGFGPAKATDFINRYKEDVALMKASGLTHYRTSINWARFLPIMKTASLMKSTPATSTTCWTKCTARA